MKNLKTRGIVLHLFALREHDVIVRLYTKEYGKISAVARGVKKVGSKLAAAIQPGNELELGLSRSKNSDLYVLTSASVTGGGIFGCGYEYYKSVCFCWQLMLQCVSEDEPNLNLYLLNADIIASAGEKIVSAPVLEICFMLKLIDMCGFFPEIDECIICKGESVNGMRISQGGIVCQNCVGSEDLHFSDGKRMLMQKLLMHDIKKPLGFKISGELCDFFRMFLIKYIKYHFELDIKL